MAPPAHSRVSRYHGWLTRHPGAVLVGSLLVFAGRGRVLSSRLQLRTAIVELLPSDDPGVVALAKTQKRMGDLSLLLIGVRSPDHDGQPALRRGADPEAPRAAARPSSPWRPTTSATSRAFFEQNKWLYVSEDGPRVDPRPAAQRDQQAQEPAVSCRWATTSRSSRCARDVAQGAASTSSFPGGVFTSKDGEYVWIAALPPGGLFVEHAGEGAVQRRQRAHRRRIRPARFHPEMRAEVGGPIVDGDRQPPGGRARHPLGDRHLPGHRRDLDRALLPPAARDSADAASRR